MRSHVYVRACLTRERLGERARGDYRVAAHFMLRTAIFQKHNSLNDRANVSVGAGREKEQDHGAGVKRSAIALLQSVG